MKKTISILGLGWLGLPLAKSLVANGYKVKGSVTSAEKIETILDNRIETSVIQITPENITISDADFFKTDVLFINFPPKRIPDIELVYPAQIGQLLPFIVANNIKKVIFISSTSVYPETNSELTEDHRLQPEKSSGLACLNAEQLLLTQVEFSSTIVRFGGLIGADRNPHRFMKRGLKNGPGKKPVNLTQLDDCIGIVQYIIANDIWDEVINGCCPVHPTREEFYNMAAKVAGVEPPTFDETDNYSFKIVNSSKLVNQLGYRFKYESPTDYLKSLI